MQSPVICLDDNPVDLKLLHTCHGLAGVEQPLVTLQDPEALFAWMDRVAAGEQPVPSTLVIDIRMPEMDGFEVVERLRRRHGGPLPRIVFFTTSRHRDDEARARALGGSLVVKPGQVDEYVDLIKNGFARD